MDVATLARRIDALEATHRTLEQERDMYKQLYLEMMERNRKLERGLMGQKSERHVPDESQLSFGVLSTMLSEREAAEIDDLPQEVKSHKRKKPTGRSPLPESLPRVDIEVIPDEVQRLGLDAFERIGEEITHVVEKRPASFVLARVIKPKFVKKERAKHESTQVFVGRTPQLPIERGVGGPGLLADTIVRRWQDHLPLHRQEEIYKREGVPISRSTICGWHSQLMPLIAPLLAAMRYDAFQAPYLCTDATGVLVQAKNKCRGAHFWVLVAPQRHVLFEYTKKHTKDAIDEVLSGYEGTLVADAHAVYDHLYERGDVVEANCWAHARRYFFKAMASDPDRAKIALELIGHLFKIERSIKTAPRRKREKIRLKHSAPVVERFFSWCDDLFPNLLETTPMHDGVRYARNQREGLKRFLKDPQIPIHNNMSERELRRQAVGRKNWLFVGSHDGGHVNAAFTSLLASCKMHDVEPWAYLRDIFCLLPLWPEHRTLELSPLKWKQTHSAEEVQALLAEDPFRALTHRG